MSAPLYNYCAAHDLNAASNLSNLMITHCKCNTPGLHMLLDNALPALRSGSMAYSDFKTTLQLLL